MSATTTTATTLITVVLRACADADRMNACIASLERQTLPLDVFDVEVVEPGQAPAAVAGEYVTYLDGADVVGERYLEALLAVARPGVVAVAPVVLVDGGNVTFPGPEDQSRMARERPWAKAVCTARTTGSDLGSPTTWQALLDSHQVVRTGSGDETVYGRRVPEMLGLADELVVVDSVAGASADLLARDVVMDAFQCASSAPGPVAGEILQRIEQSATVVRPADGAWSTVPALVERFAGVVAGWEQSRGQSWSTLFSRSADPVPHLLAAFAKVAQPSLRWTAALLPSAEGPALAIPGEDELVRVLLHAVTQAGGVAEPPADAAGLCDLLVRTLADEVVGDVSVERGVAHAAAH